MIALITITLLSIAVAVVMSVFAWRLAREERLRSEARVQALAADIRETGGDEIASPVAVHSLFTAEMRPETSTPFRALAIGAVIVGAALSAIVVIAGRPGEHSGARTATVTAESQSTEPPPLELTSLEHEAESDGFVIRGTVVDRNPSPSNLPLTAVVFASNTDGIVVGSGHAPLEIASSSASSGVESGFVVSITGVGEIRRYRVSFRRGDRTIAHVDRRDRLVTAQLP